MKKRYVRAEHPYVIQQRQNTISEPEKPYVMKKRYVRDEHPYVIQQRKIFNERRDATESINV